MIRYMNGTHTTPHRLYKYRQVDMFTSDIFCRGVLWFSRPSAFNDPYDCVPVFDTTVDREGFRQHLMSGWEETYPHWTPAELTEYVNMQVALSWPLNEARVERYKHDFKQRLESIGVFSASARNDSVLMWSHYADNHRGICLELDPSAVPPNVQFHRTQYQAKRPVINLFRDRREANRLAAGVKSCEWEYEQEWRLVLEKTKSTPPFPCEITLPEGMLKGVILGERIDDADRQRVQEWCSLLPVRPKIYQAGLDVSEFKVNRKPVAEL